jgi:hypothetical protein
MTPAPLSIATTEMHTGGEPVRSYGGLDHSREETVWHYENGLPEYLLDQFRVVTFCLQPHEVSVQKCNLFVGLLDEDFQLLRGDLCTEDYPGGFFLLSLQTSGTQIDILSV